MDGLKGGTSLSGTTGNLSLPLAGEDGGVSGVSSSCGACGGFLTRQDEDLREPLVQCQGSHAEDLHQRRWAGAQQQMLTALCCSEPVQGKRSWIH